MPTVNPSSLGGPKPQFVDLTGAPASGYRLFWYVGGSVGTKQNTYTDSTGNTANMNPIVLDSLGEPQNEIWLVSGESYAVTFAPPGTDDPPTSAIWTVDNIRGINDTALTVSQWESGPTPTFISSLSFILVGDQTGDFQVGRRVQITDAISNKYGTIVSSVFTTLTTVTIVTDDGTTLSSPLSAVWWGILSATNDSIPRGTSHGAEIDIASATTTNIGAVASENIRFTGSATITSFGTANKGIVRRFRSAGAITLTHNATSLILPGAANINMLAGATGVAVSLGSGNWYVSAYTPANGTAISGSIQRSYLAGLGMFTAGTSQTMTIAAGQATDSTNTVSMTLPLSINKTTSAWAVGTGNGGIDTGTIANATWYHFYVIERLDTGVVDIVFSLNATTPTLPANYTVYRRIGSGLTNGSAQWVQFIQAGDLFEWTTPVLETTSASPGTSAVTQTLANSPTGVNVTALINTYWASNGSLYISDLATFDFAPSTTVAPLNSISTGGAGAASQSGFFSVRTNTSAQFRYRLGANAQILIATLGWRDSRGRDS